MRAYRKKHLYFILPLLAAVAFFSWALARFQTKASPSSSSANVLVGGHQIGVLVADEPEEWRQGLSGHPGLAPGQGMFFVFPDSQVRSFWMRNMLFPLDIIWIDGGRVAGIASDLPPAGERPEKSYSSGVPVRYVLEVLAGTARQLGIRIGDEVIINIK